jgi:hypothetical protein
MKTIINNISSAIIEHPLEIFGPKNVENEHFCVVISQKQNIGKKTSATKNDHLNK